MSSTSDRYDRLTIALHWTIGIGIILIAAAELIRGEFPKGSAMREGLKAIHNPAGTVVFVLVLLRIAWRFADQRPHGRPGAARWEAMAARAMHMAMYVMMIAIPLLGILFTFARGRSIDFGPFQVALPLQNVIPKAAMKVMRELHEFTGTAVLGLALVHALAALWHHYLRKDGVLLRMLPARTQASS